MIANQNGLEKIQEILDFSGLSSVFRFQARNEYNLVIKKLPLLIKKRDHNLPHQIIN